MDNDALSEIVVRLFTLMNERGIDYVLVGGIAMLQYIEGRNTEDIDLILAADALENLPEISISGRDACFARGSIDGLKIDFRLTHNPLFEHIRCRHSTIHSFHEQDIPTATVEGLLLLKLYALPSLYRQGNFARVGLYENDIATLLHTYRPDPGLLFDELTPFVNTTDRGALREIVDEIMARIERFDKGRDAGEPASRS